MHQPVSYEVSFLFISLPPKPISSLHVILGFYGAGSEQSLMKGTVTLYDLYEL